MCSLHNILLYVTVPLWAKLLLYWMRWLFSTVINSCLDLDSSYFGRWTAHITLQYMYVFRSVTIIATHRHSHRLYANCIKHVIIFEYGTHQAFKLQNRKRLLPWVSALLEWEGKLYTWQAWGLWFPYMCMFAWISLIALSRTYCISSTDCRIIFIHIKL